MFLRPVCLSQDAIFSVFAAIEAISTGTWLHLESSTVLLCKVSVRMRLKN